MSAASPVRGAEAHVAERFIEPHDHDYFEVFVVRSGTATHVTASYQLPAIPGTVGILSPGEVHAFMDCDNLHVTNVYYLAEWFLHDVSNIADREHLRALFLEPALFAPQQGRVVPQLEMGNLELGVLLRDLDDLHCESAAETPSLVYLRATLLKCMVMIARAYTRVASVPQTRLRDEAWAVMQQCERALKSGDAPDLSSIAASFTITRDHLCRIFKFCTGMSPSAYFTRRRVFVAAAQLLNPSARVTDIALELGFSDSAHFSRQFRRELGVSPREYRALYSVRSATSLHSV